jgi:hypothetical protein
VLKHWEADECKYRTPYHRTLRADCTPDFLIIGFVRREYLGGLPL